MTAEPFDDLGWHDNAIHGFGIAEGDDKCSGRLTLDIDHILEWIPPADGEQRFLFVVAPAKLVFHEVTGLVIAVDYASCSAALQPMTIDVVRRDVVTYPNGYSSFSWKIELNWPEGGFISFHSPHMSQTLTGEPVRSTAQWLMPSQRVWNRKA